MKKETNKTLVGAFVIGALILVIAGMMAFGSGSLFKRPHRYVMYFAGSVKGLNLGAPVQLKGVAMGKVVSISLVYSETDNAFFTQVVFDIPQGAVNVVDAPDGSGKHLRDLTNDNAIDEMISNGLRAKLELQSFVTGQLLVAFDFYPKTPVTLMRFSSDLKELPTLPSDMEALAKTLDGVDFQSIVDSIRKAAQGIEKLATAPGLHAAVGSINDTLTAYHRLADHLDHQVGVLADDVRLTLADARHLMKTTDSRVSPALDGITDTAADLKMAVGRLDARIGPMVDRVEETLAAIRSAFEKTDAVVSNLGQLTDADAPLVYNISETLDEIRRAADALGVLADYLSRHPEALIKGKTEKMER